MNRFNLSLITIMMLGFTGIASAEPVVGHEESANRLNHSFSSKRAYHAPVALSVANQEAAQFEGATYVSNDEDGADSKKARHLKQLQMHSIGRRP